MRGVESGESARSDWAVVRASGEPLAADPARGQRLPDGAVIGGKYVVRRVIGRGSGSTVYHGEQLSIARRVAIKVLASVQKGSEQHQRLVREARLLAELTDEALVRVFDLGWLEVGTGAVVMELLEGETLRERLRRVGAMPPAELLPLMIDALEGLATVHAQRIVHRDLRPANLFLANKRGGVAIKIIDFGLGRALDDASRLTALGQVVGTPAYMAPEQFLRSTSVDERADLYSVGVTLYEALVGRAPFVGNAAELPLRILRDTAPAPRSIRPELSPELEALLVKSIARSPGDRFQSASEMSEALRHVIG
jgi:serine/threonine protein kinase